MNLLEKPYTCPAAGGEGMEDVATPEEERSILSRTLLPFNVIIGSLWAFDAKLKALISGRASQEVKCN